MPWPPRPGATGTARRFPATRRGSRPRGAPRPPRETNSASVGITTPWPHDRPSRGRPPREGRKDGRAAALPPRRSAPHSRTQPTSPPAKPPTPFTAAQPHTADRPTASPPTPFTTAQPTSPQPARDALHRGTRPTSPRPARGRSAGALRRLLLSSPSPASAGPPTRRAGACRPRRRRPVRCGGRVRPGGPGRRPGSRRRIRPSTCGAR